MTSFFDQYKTPQWQKRRLERLEASGWACMECESDSAQLHVHHTRYVQGRKVWEYPDGELKVLCDTCHESAHQQKTALQLLIGHMSIHDADEVMAYACALLAMNKLNEASDASVVIHNDAHITGVANKVGIPETVVIGAMQGGKVSVQRLLDSRKRPTGAD